MSDVMDLARARAVLDGDGPLWFADEALHREACAVVLAYLDSGKKQREIEGSLSRTGDRRRRRDVLVIPLTEWIPDEEA